MARTDVPLSELSVNSNLADPAGTSGDATNNHIISGAAPEEIVIRVVNGDTAAHTATVLAGASPPALSAGQGDLAQSVGASSTEWLGPFTSARFVQADGSLHLDLDADTSVTVTAFHMPRSA